MGPHLYSTMNLFIFNYSSTLIIFILLTLKELIDLAFCEAILIVIKQDLHICTGEIPYLLQ